MDTSALDYVVTECKALLETRFPDGSEHGAAAMLLEDGTVVTGTAPDMPNAAVEVCHEIEPYCAAHRLDLRVVASVCCLLYTSPSPRDLSTSRMPSSA